MEFTKSKIFNCLIFLTKKNKKLITQNLRMIGQALIRLKLVNERVIAAK